MIETQEVEDSLSREIEIAEYTAKYHKAKIELARVTKTGSLAPTVSFLQLFPTAMPIQSNVRALKLPKIELRKFGGKIKDWLSFWSTFQKIHDDATLSREDKFHYLLQSMVKDSRAF